MSGFLTLVDTAIRNASSIISSSIDILLNLSSYGLTSLVLNVTSDVIDTDTSQLLGIVNSLSYIREQLVYVLVTDITVGIQDGDTGECVTVQLVPAWDPFFAGQQGQHAEQQQHQRHDASGNPLYEMYWVSILPALGIKTYLFDHQCISLVTQFTMVGINSPVTIANDITQVSLTVSTSYNESDSSSTTWLTHRDSHGVASTLQQEFLNYVTCNGKPGDISKCSGAYIFR